MNTVTDTALSDADARAAVAALDEPSLKSYGVEGYYLNFLSLFGEHWPVTRIRALAIEAARSKVWGEWEFSTHFARCRREFEHVPGEEAAQRLLGWTRLSGWDASPIPILAAEGRGVIVCIFHLGAFRLVPPDLTTLGYHVTQAVDVAGFGDAERLTRGLPTVVHERYHAVNIEQPGSALQLVRPLRHGELVAVNIDGNTGVDGRWGTESRSRIRFAGFSVLVKNGMARLAAMTGAPLVGVVALREPEAPVGRLFFSKPIIPESTLRGASADAFTDHTMAELYAFFEPYALAHPEQWESATYLHSTRVHVQDARHTPVTAGTSPAAIDDHLDAGGILRANATCVVPTQTKSGEAWIDVRTLQTYRLPAAARAAELLNALRTSGVDAEWLDAATHQEGREWRRGIVALLAQLATKRLIVTEQRPVAAAAAGGTRNTREVGIPASSVDVPVGATTRRGNFLTLHEEELP